MKNLVDDLVVTCDKIENLPKSATINPSDGINYWHIGFVLLLIAYLLLLVVMVGKFSMKRELTT